MATVSHRTYIVEGLKISLTVLKAAAAVLPAPLSEIVELAQNIIAALENMQSNREDCATIRTRILQLLPVILMAAKKNTDNERGVTKLSQDFWRNIQRIQENLETILITLRKINADHSPKGIRKKLKAFVRSNSNASAISRCRDDLDWALAAFEVSSSLAGAVQLCELTAKIHTEFHDHRLETLPRSKYASHSSERPDRPSTCFQGTRTSLIEGVFDWVYDPDPASDRIFFLNGIAGVGKTTIARTVAERARGEGHLGGNFFFSHQGEADLRNASKVFPTLAYQLAHFDPEFGHRIVQALEKDPQAPFEGLKQQLDQLIIHPLSDVERDAKRTVLLVFDAFDECEPRGAKDILQLLLAAIPSLPFFLKIFLTSRPEHHLLSVLAQPTEGLVTTVLHDVEPLIVKNDIRIYVRARFARLPGDLGLDLTPGWAAEDEIELLIEKSGGLFIYAVTCLRFLSDPVVLDPRVQFDILLTIFQSNSPVPEDTDPFRDLDILYMQLLRTALSSTNTSYVLRTLQAVLGTIVILRDPLPQAAIETLSSLQPGQASSSLRLLQSVILPAAPPDHCPRIYHPSFPDFIQDPSRCTEERFYVDVAQQETRLAAACLRLMSSALRNDMVQGVGDADCNAHIKDLDSKLASAYPPAVRYACRHWASHLVKSAHNDRDVVAALDAFAMRSLILWVEAMSWLGETRSALKITEMIKPWISTSGCSSSTFEVVHDLRRLLLGHLTLIAGFTPHLLRSVLPFVPSQTLLAKTYLDTSSPSLRVVSGTDPGWSPCLMTLRPPDTAYSVVYSSDQRRLLCGTSHGVIIFESSTGAILASVDLWYSVDTAHLLPDGDQIVLIKGRTRGMRGRSPIAVLDTATGREVAMFHDASVMCLSPNGRLLASDFKSVADEEMIRVWGVKDSSNMIQWKASSGPITCIKFSPDSRRLATSSKRSQFIEIWDAETGARVVKLKQSEPVVCLAFSPDGHQLAAGLCNATIQVLDLESFSPTVVLCGHSAEVVTLDFSPDGQYIASGSEADPVMLWNVAGKEVLGTFSGQKLGVTSAAFSPDGSQIISHSSHGTVCLWDFAGGRLTNPIPTTNTPDVSVIRFEFSPDGTRNVSAFSSGLLQVSSETRIVELETQPFDNARRIFSLSFSSDGRWVAAGYSDSSIRVWDSSSGRQVAVIRHPRGVLSMAFSPDGAYIAAAFDEWSVRIWKVAHGEIITTIDSTPLFRALSFSPDGKQIAGGSEDGSLHVWSLLPPTSSLESSQIPSPFTIPAVERVAGPASVVQTEGHSRYSKVSGLKLYHRQVTRVIWFDDGTRIATMACGCPRYDGWGTEVSISNLATGITNKILKEDVTSGWMLFCPDGMPMNSDHDEDAAVASLAVVTLSEGGQLRFRLGKRSRTWMLPPDIVVPKRTPLTFKSLGSGKVRVVVGAGGAGSITLDLIL